MLVFRLDSLCGVGDLIVEIYVALHDTPVLINVRILQYSR